MADKTIGELQAVSVGDLPLAPDIYDDTKIPVEQSGEAKHMTGAQWKAYAKSAAAESAAAAEQARQGAETARSGAEAAQQGAEAAKDAAELAKTAAETAANNASNYAAEALTAKNEAETAKNAAAGSAEAAQNGANAAAQSAEAANTAKTAAQEAAGAAQQYAENAAQSAAAAAESAGTLSDTIADVAQLKIDITTEAARAKAEEKRIEDLFVMPTQEAVNTWLDAHPEATTTVQDRAIIPIKLHNGIQDEASLQTAIGKTYGQFVGTEITINNPIIISPAGAYSKTIENCTFTLNSNMFTWDTSYAHLPRFVNCVFIGNGHYLIDGKKYLAGCHFINCIFINCGLCEHSIFVQSAKFISCRFSGAIDFITADSVTDAAFCECQWESDWIGVFIKTESGGNYKGINQVKFDNCISEGISKEFVRVEHGGDISFTGCYFQRFSKSLVNYYSTTATNPFIEIFFSHCTISCNLTDSACINIDSSYPVGFSGRRTRIIVEKCFFDTSSENQKIINTLKYPDTIIRNNSFGNINLWEVSQTENFGLGSSLIKWNTGGTEFTVMPEALPCIVTWDTSRGGWNLQCALVGYAHTVPFARSLTASVTNFTATKNADDSITVSLGDYASTAMSSRSCVPLNKMPIYTGVI